MLQPFDKYKYVELSKNILNINYRIKHKKIVSYMHKNSKIGFKSTFYRKFYFRSLLLYINILYSNLLISSDSNYFYYAMFIITYCTNKHPSFYFKKRIVK